MQQKIVDLETLTKKGDEVAQLQQAAREMLDKLAPLREDLQLKDDPELKKQIEEAEGIAADLDQQAKDIFTEIDKIGRQPDVTDKIYVEGMAINEQNEADKKLKEDFEKDIKGFAQKITEYADVYNAWYVERNRRYTATNEEVKKIGSLVNEVLKKFPNIGGRNKIDLNSIGVFNFTNHIVLSGKRIDEILANLSEARKSLGFFGEREKGLIDLILSNKAEFDAYKKVSDAAETQQNKFATTIESEQLALVTDYKNFTAKYDAEGSSLRFHFYGKINDLLQEADKSAKEGTRTVKSGKYIFNQIYEDSGRR